MNTLSTRDKWLATFLPAMVILLVGWVFFLRPSSRDVTLLRNRVQNQGSVSERRDLVTLALSERDALDKQVAAKREELSRGPGNFDHNAGMQQISMLCTEFGLSLNAATSEAAGMQIPPVLRDIASMLAREGRPPPVQCRVELSGSYGAVLKLLEGLARTQPLIVPLNLSMTLPAEGHAPPAWVLTLWL